MTETSQPFTILFMEEQVKGGSCRGGVADLLRGYGILDDLFKVNAGLNMVLRIKLGF